MIEHVVVEKVNNIYVQVHADDGIIREMSEFFTFSTPGYQFSPAFRNKYWDGKIRLLNTNTKQIYVGLVPYIKKFCKDSNYGFEYLDEEKEVHPIDTKNLATALSLPLEPRDYQLLASSVGLTKKRTVLISPTASGKSLIIYMMIRHLLNTGKKRGLLIVPTINLVTQMHSDFKNYSSNNGWDVDKYCQKIFGGESNLTYDGSILKTTGGAIDTGGGAIDTVGGGINTGAGTITLVGGDIDMSAAVGNIQGGGVANINNFDNITANSKSFDIPYLYYRISKVLSEEVAQYLSPIQKVKPTTMFDAGAMTDFVVVGGINHLDYMNLFKKFITKQEPSYALGNIGEKYVKLGKVEYKGSLDRLFQDDINKFIEYNIRDVEIIVELEKALKFIELTVTIAHLCHTTYESIYYSTVLNDGAISVRSATLPPLTVVTAVRFPTRKSLGVSSTSTRPSSS